jgi:hypothetical protein
VVDVVGVPGGDNLPLGGDGDQLIVVGVGEIEGVVGTEGDAGEIGGLVGDGDGGMPQRPRRWPEGESLRRVALARSRVKRVPWASTAADHRVP